MKTAPKALLVGDGWVVKNSWVPALQGFGWDYVVFDPLCYADRASLERALLDEIQRGLNLSVVATPNSTHHYFGSILIGHSVPVVIEKPPATSKSQLQDLVSLQEQTLSAAEVASPFRYREDFRHFLSLISKHPEQVRDLRMAWDRREGVPGIGSWFVQKEHSGGGALMDIGWHLLDLARQILGDLDGFVLEGAKFERLPKDELEPRSSASWRSPGKRQTCTIDVERAAAIELSRTGTKISIEVDWNKPGVDTDTSTVIAVIGDSEIRLDTTFGFSSNRLSKSLVVELAGGKAIHRRQFCNLAERGHFAQFEHLQAKISMPPAVSQSLVYSLQIMKLVESAYASQTGS